ncbi:hypothetical protein Hanom_Chr14g01265231 [Helianthus anomalus]
MGDADASAAEELDGYSDNEDGENQMEDDAEEGEIRSVGLKVDDRNDNEPSP